MDYFINKYKLIWIFLTGITTLSFILSGCAAIHTSIAKKDLNVQTKMSDTLFLDPIEPDQKIVYLNIHNTSDRADFDIDPLVTHLLQNKGYHITEDAKAAHYWLQVNVLNVEKTDLTAAESALRAGYGRLGSVAMGAAVGTATGAAIDGWSSAGIGSLAGAATFGLVDTLTSAAVKDVTFVAIADVEIAERIEDKSTAREDWQQDSQQVVEGLKRKTSSTVNKMKKYRVRVVSTANKANLEYEEAVPGLTNGLARAISGLF